MVLYSLISARAFWDEVSIYFIINASMKKSQKQSAKKGEDKKQSSLTRQKLVDFLARSAEVERKLEIIKEMLAEEEDYSPASLFHRIDSARQGFIN